MSALSPKVEERVLTFFSLQRCKLFRRETDYVAFYGDPAMSDDGWIINLPAQQVFQINYHSLPFEIELNVSWVNEQVPLNQPLADYIANSISSISWAEKASTLGMPNYALADLFRDISLLLSKHSHPLLAFEFIKEAHRLRPNGPAINIILDGLKDRLSA